MIIEILSHTPLWVFALFFGLLYLGYIQSKTRTVSLTRLVIIPVVMLGLSFYGMWNTFYASTLALTCWSIAFALGATIALLLISVKRVSYTAKTQTFLLPGSWLPLSLMMAIFCTKYMVGILLAQHSELLAQTSFVGIASVAYGVFSGVFFGRTLKIMSAREKKEIRSALAV